LVGTEVGAALHGGAKRTGVAAVSKRNSVVAILCLVDEDRHGLEQSNQARKELCGVYVE